MNYSPYSHENVSFGLDHHRGDINNYQQQYSPQYHDQQSPQQHSTIQHKHSFHHSSPPNFQQSPQSNLQQNNLQQNNVQQNNIQQNNIQNNLQNANINQINNIHHSNIQQPNLQHKHSFQQSSSPNFSQPPLHKNSYHQASPPNFQQQYGTSPFSSYNSEPVRRKYSIQPQMIHPHQAGAINLIHQQHLYQSQAISNNSNNFSTTPNSSQLSVPSNYYGIQSTNYQGDFMGECPMVTGDEGNASSQMHINISNEGTNGVQQQISPNHLMGSPTYSNNVMHPNMVKFEDNVNSIKRQQNQGIGLNDQNSINSKNKYYNHYYESNVNNNTYKKYSMDEYQSTPQDVSMSSGYGGRKSSCYGMPSNFYSEQQRHLSHGIGMSNGKVNNNNHMHNPNVINDVASVSPTPLNGMNGVNGRGMVGGSSNNEEMTGSSMLMPSSSHQQVGSYSHQEMAASAAKGGGTSGKGRKVSSSHLKSFTENNHLLHSVNVNRLSLSDPNSSIYTNTNSGRIDESIIFEESEYKPMEETTSSYTPPPTFTSTHSLSGNGSGAGKKRPPQDQARSIDCNESSSNESFKERRLRNYRPTISIMPKRWLPSRKNGFVIGGSVADTTNMAEELEQLRKVSQENEKKKALQSQFESMEIAENCDFRNRTESIVNEPSEEEPAVKKVKGQMRAQLNVGKAYQAKVRKWGGRKISDDERKTTTWDRGEKLFDPAVTSHLTDESVAAYEALACSDALNTRGRNIELALHILYENKGNLQASFCDLMRCDTIDWEQYPIIYNTGYNGSDKWSASEVATFTDSIYKTEKNFALISADIGTKNIKQCISFYYLWKKDYPDDNEKLRRLLKKKSLLEAQLAELSTMEVGSAEEALYYVYKDGDEMDEEPILSMDAESVTLSATLSQIQPISEPQLPGGITPYPWMQHNDKGDKMKVASPGDLLGPIVAQNSPLPNPSTPNPPKKGAQPQSDGFFHCRMCDKRFEKVKSLNAHCKVHGQAKLKAEKQRETQQSRLQDNHMSDNSMAQLSQNVSFLNASSLNSLSDVPQISQNNNIFSNPALNSFSNLNLLSNAATDKLGLKLLNVMPNGNVQAPHFNSGVNLQNQFLNQSNAHMLSTMNNQLSQNLMSNNGSGLNDPKLVNFLPHNSRLGSQHNQFGLPNGDLLN